LGAGDEAIVSDELDMFGPLPGMDTKSYPGTLAPRQPTLSLASDRLALLDLCPSKEYMIGNVATKCYTIGSVAKVLDRKTVTIRSWEMKGWIKPPKFRTKRPDGQQIPGQAVKGRRLYSRDQVEYLIRSFEACSLDDPKKAQWDKFRSLLQNYPTH
jgi:hypothetical protein